MGIRSTSTHVETLGAGDTTSHGTYWFDLRTRRPAAARVKRLLDVALSLALIVLFAPLMLIVALVKLTSRGPAVLKQPRIGFRCTEFRMYKFRTMIAGAQEWESELKEEVASHFFKLEDDPRITKVGRILRRFSLDELPQLFNVLEGCMSLVGPRPLLLSDLDRQPIRSQMRRFSVLPGITGLWQVSGRSLTTDHERMQLDRDYINQWSLWLDVKILVRTIGAVLSGRGAL